MSFHLIRQHLIRLDYLLAMLIILSQVLEYRNFTSLFFYMTFIVTVLLWICTVGEDFTGLDLFTLIIMVVALIAVLINGIAAGAAFSFSYLKKYIMFVCTLLFFAAAGRNGVDRRTRRMLVIMQLVTTLVMLVAYLTRTISMYMLNGAVSSYLTLRFTNPQLTALFLACMIMFLTLAVVQERSWFLKILSAVAVCCNGFFLVETQCRTAQIAVVVFLVVLLERALLRRVRAPIWKWVMAVNAVMPIVVVTFYMQFLSKDWFRNMFSFMTGEGKGLDSRYLIWSSALSLLRESPVFGAYYEASGGVGYSQMHNTHLDIAVSYGVLTMILVCIFLYIVMRRVQERPEAGMEKRKSYRSVALIGFICAILLGSGEAALFSGGLGIYIYAGVFLLNFDWETSEVPETVPSVSEKEPEEQEEQGIV